jgi:hypothetical protein
MISDDKMQHIVHLMLDGIEKAKLVTYSNKELAVREARKVALQHMAMLSKVAETARQRISSQKNPPPEHSSQWDTLYQKYYEEEWKKKGG